MTHEILTQEYLNSILRYDPDTGFLYWVNGRGNQTARAGQRAGSFHAKTGYINIKINGATYRAHRIIWLMIHGYYPPEIDHKNRIRHDNRDTNIRAAGRTENCQNRGIRSDNSSGIKGVHWHTQSAGWRAKIHVYGKEIGLGSHSTLFAAACARVAAENQYFGE